LFVAGFAAVSNINEVVELCNIGTLFAFILVAGGILALRSTDPDRPRPFRTPLVPWVPVGAIISCIFLMRELPALTWWRFFLWLAGFIIYVGVVFWVRGCGKYAFSKGYSRWLGIIGLLGPIGLGIIFLLPGKAARKL